MNEIIQNYKEILTQKYCKFSGRANRSEFWYFVLVNAIVAVVLYILLAIAAFSSSSAAGVIYAVLVIYDLAVLLPGLGVTVRRLHDIGKGGGWIFISLVPLIGGLILLYFMIVEGNQGANRFGDQPE